MALAGCHRIPRPVSYLDVTRSPLLPTELTSEPHPHLSTILIVHQAKRSATEVRDVVKHPALSASTTQREPLTRDPPPASDQSHEIHRHHAGHAEAYGEADKGDENDSDVAIGISTRGECQRGVYRSRSSQARQDGFVSCESLRGGQPRGRRQGPDEPR